MEQDKELIALDLLCLDITGLKLIKELRYYDTVDSTNERARALLQSDELKNDALIMAGEQKAGKGRRGRGWISPPGGLWFSLVKHCEANAARLPLVSLAAGLAVAEGLDSQLPEAAVLKWPNDVMVAGRKICGILVEVFLHPERGRQLIIGVGINVNNDPGSGLEQPSQAIALKDIAGAPCELEAVLMDVLRAFDKYYDLFLNQRDQEIVDAFRNRLAHLGQVVNVTAGERQFAARCLGIAGDGSLLIENEEGQPERITAADVSLIETV